MKTVVWAAVASAAVVVLSGCGLMSSHDAPATVTVAIAPPTTTTSVDPQVAPSPAMTVSPAWTSDADRARYCQEWQQTVASYRATVDPNATEDTVRRASLQDAETNNAVFQAATPDEQQAFARRYIQRTQAC